MKRILFFILVAAGIQSLSYGQQASGSNENGKWEKIGETTINLSEDYGIFNWDRDRAESVNANDKYSAIKFRAKDAKVNLTDVKVEYGNGKKEDLKLGSTIDENSDSKALPLDTRQDLDKVTFNFLKDENAGAKNAVVEIWGLKEGASGMGQRDKDVIIEKNNKDTKEDVDREIHKSGTEVEKDKLKVDIDTVTKVK
ncbi:MAG TPA: hypothetical protein VHO46_16085 [Bacteroidales bacterium]|nr:hypothetical protein [Bacteroidales bacterium]